MDVTQALRILAQFSAGPLPVISVYLNTQWRDPQQRARTTTFFERHLHQARALEPETAAACDSLTRDLERLTDWGQQHLQSPEEHTTPGVALFACAAADLWIECPSSLPFEDEFSIVDRPMLRQLAHLDAKGTKALFVMVDSRAARIYEVVLGGLRTERDFAHALPGRHNEGGWGQARYQRRVKEHMDRHHKEVAAYVTTYMAAHPHTHLMISGQEEGVANFQSYLPPSVQQQILDHLTLDMQDTRQHIMAVAQETLQRHEREEEQATVQLLVNRAGHGGLAVLGQQETLAAVNTARVQHLVLASDFHQDGGRCLTCGALTADTPPQCSICGGLLTAVELGEAMVQAVLQADGFVEQIAPDPRLTAYEGVGALVRYK